MKYSPGTLRASIVREEFVGVNAAERHFGSAIAFSAVTLACTPVGQCANQCLLVRAR